MAPTGGLVYSARMRLRGLLWLVAFVALVLPPLGSPNAAAAMSGHEFASDCDHHAPPPPCPDKGNAKHAAGLCCPLMGQVFAALPACVEAIASDQSGPMVTKKSARLDGLSPHKDPPPPRV